MSITSQEISCTKVKPQASTARQESGDLPKLSSRQIGGDSFSLEQLRGAMSELYYAIEFAMQHEDESVLGRIRRAGAMLRLEVVSERPESNSDVSKDAGAVTMRGGLAPWQIVKVTNYLEANIGVSIPIADLAQLVGVSSWHFCHAFKESFRISPHAYLMRRRVERAQGLMLATRASLSQIAVDCGLADQAHFSKLFRRYVGESPGAWRRARLPAPAR
jgi:transcriptional regulator GlxA family with amidase domain